MEKGFLNTQEDIDAWLSKYNILNYKLIPDEKYGFVVDVLHNVWLNNKGLHKIPVKFNKVDGSFDCSFNKLKSLEFAPKIVLGSFVCSSNIIKSLKNVPEYIGGSLYCDDNELERLDFFPNHIGSICNMRKNKLNGFNLILEFSLFYEEYKRQESESLNNKINIMSKKSSIIKDRKLNKI